MAAQSNSRCRLQAQAASTEHRAVARACAPLPNRRVHNSRGQTTQEREHVHARRVMHMAFRPCCNVAAIAVAAQTTMHSPAQRRASWWLRNNNYATTNRPTSCHQCAVCPQARRHTHATLLSILHCARAGPSAAQGSSPANADARMHACAHSSGPEAQKLHAVHVRHGQVSKCTPHPAPCGGSTRNVC